MRDYRVAVFIVGHMFTIRRFKVETGGSIASMQYDLSDEELELVALEAGRQSGTLDGASYRAYAPEQPSSFR